MNIPAVITGQGDFTRTWPDQPTQPAQLLTHSRMQSFKACPRKHYYAYELAIRPDDTAKALRLGSAVHLGLDARAKGRSAEDAAIMATASYETLPTWATSDETRHEWYCEREIVARLLMGYWWYWENTQAPPDITPVEIIESEKVFHLPIVNPTTGYPMRDIMAGGKRDAIVKLGDGRRAVMEHKTTSDDIAPDSDYWKRLKIDQQISLYMLDSGCETVLYDVIRKPSIKPQQIPVLDENQLKIVVDTATGERCLKSNIKKDGTPGAGHGEPYQSANAEKGWVLQTRVETPEEFGDRLSDDIGERPERYFARREIARIAADLADFREELFQQAHAIHEAQKNGRHFRNTASCIGFGRCPYFEPCTSGHDFTTVPAGFVRVSDLHPELSGDD